MSSQEVVQQGATSVCSLVSECTYVGDLIRSVKGGSMGHLHCAPHQGGVLPTMMAGSPVPSLS